MEEIIYENPNAGNELILRENKEMTKEIIFQAIDKIKEYNLISSMDGYTDIGLMENKRWEEFFKTMSDYNVYDKELNWKNSYSLEFINRR